MTIFYFTGTGNSLFVARKFTGARLISIPQAMSTRQNYADDTIGFVYPQYAAGLPKMVRSFIVNNTFEADYIFAINLWSFIRAGALGEIAGIVPLNYGAYLKTPNNFIFLFNSPNNPRAALAKTEMKLAGIIDDILNKKIKAVKPRKKIGNATKYFGESKFKVAETCTRCGLCEKVCPAKNISVGEGVVFGNDCENCFACANLCPAHALYSNNAMRRRRQYRNPFVSVDELIGENLFR